jgi:putative oxidoreductase
MTDHDTTSGVPHFFLNTMRIVFALMFMQHGAQKLFGAFGAQGTAEPMTLFWVAGVLETFGGLLILIGLGTRPVAVVLAGEMAVAYFTQHLPQGFVPIMNGGELAVLYCWTFLFFAAAGGGAFSVDGWLAARRRDRVGI